MWVGNLCMTWGVGQEGGRSWRDEWLVLPGGWAGMWEAAGMGGQVMRSWRVGQEGEKPRRWVGECCMPHFRAPELL